VFDMRLRTLTGSTWKVLKLDRKTPVIFFHQKEWEPCSTYLPQPGANHGKMPYFAVFKCTLCMYLLQCTVTVSSTIDKSSLLS